MTAGIKMGFKKPMDYNSVNHQIYMAGIELNSPYNDGYTAFEVKKELYKLKWLIDEILKESSEFSGELEWIEEHSKQKMWRTLKK
mgnify:CR=1 FL=1